MSWYKPDNSKESLSTQKQNHCHSTKSNSTKNLSTQQHHCHVTKLTKSCKQYHCHGTNPTTQKRVCQLKNKTIVTVQNQIQQRICQLKPIQPYQNRSVYHHGSTIWKNKIHSKKAIASTLVRAAKQKKGPKKVNSCNNNQNDCSSQHDSSK